MTCECSDVGWCARYRRHTSDRSLSICRSEVMTPEACETYRQHWAALANGNPITQPSYTNGLSDAELTELFPNEDATLIGNRIKAMTEALGIPTCAGCNTRRKWINDAHEWWRRQRAKLDLPTAHP